MLRFEIDTEYSSEYIKLQVEKYKKMLDLVLELKIQEEEKEKEEEQKISKNKRRGKRLVSRILELNKNDEEDEEMDIESEPITPPKLEIPVIEPIPSPPPPQPVVVRDTRPIPVGSVICECGVQYVSKNKCRHIKSKHHIETMKFKNINC
jgi:hypothetical protein